MEAVVAPNFYNWNEETDSESLHPIDKSTLLRGNKNLSLASAPKTVYVVYPKII